MSDITNIAIPVLALLYVLVRQVQRRQVKEGSGRIFLVLLVIGGYEVVSYLGDHKPSATVVGVLVASLVLAAGFGAVRAYTVRLWREGGALYRQGNALTVVLWLVAIAAHFGADLLIDHDHSAPKLASVGLLLYIAVSFGAQRLVLASRAAGQVRTAVG